MTLRVIKCDKVFSINNLLTDLIVCVTLIAIIWFSVYSPFFHWCDGFSRDVIVLHKSVCVWERERDREEMWWKVCVWECESVRECVWCERERGSEKDRLLENASEYLLFADAEPLLNHYTLARWRLAIMLTLNNARTYSTYLSNSASSITGLASATVIFFRSDFLPPGQ